jgi:hypothetical protein
MHEEKLTIPTNDLSRLPHKTVILSEGEMGAPHLAFEMWDHPILPKTAEFRHPTGSKVTRSAFSGSNPEVVRIWRSMSTLA